MRMVQDGQNSITRKGRLLPIGSLRSAGNAPFLPSLSAYNSASGVEPDLILDFDAGVYARRVAGVLTTVALSDVVSGASLITGPDGVRRLRTQAGDVATANIAAYNIASGTIVTRASQPLTVGAFERIWQIDNGTENNRISHWLQNTNRYWMNVQSAGVSTVNIPSGPDIGPKAFRSASAWATNNCAISVDGQAVTTDFDVTIPTGVTVLRFGHRVGGDKQPGGGIERLVLFTSRLSDADLTAASANDLRYVETTGSDANDGLTESTPWATSAHAGQTAPAGSTVYMKAGTYSPFSITAGGSEGSYTTFCAYPGAERAVVIDGGSPVNTTRFDGQADATAAGWSIGDATGTPGQWLAGIRAYGQSYIRIAGFHVRNLSSQHPGGKKPCGIEIFASEAVGASAIRGIRIANNRVANTRSSGIMVAGQRFDLVPVNAPIRVSDVIIEDNDCSLNVMIDPWYAPRHNEAISVGGGVSDLIVRGNSVYESPAYGIDFKAGVLRGLITGNHVYGHEHHAIYIDAGNGYVRDVTISKNRCHDSKTGVTIARETATQTHEINRIDVFNNLFWDLTECGVLLYKHSADQNDPTWGIFRDVKLRNNTIHSSGINGIRVAGLDQIGQGFVFANNISVSSTGDDIHYALTAPAVTKSANLTSDATGEITGDPLFVNVAEGVEDFHLRAGSPAINSADAAYAPPDDYAGVPRTTPDIGAFERIGA